MNTFFELWSKRVKDYWNMAIRYLRLIGNSGFLFAIYIAIVVGSFYYSELLKWLPSSFPATIFLAIVTALLLTKSPLRTFLKEGDLVFLSPVEGKLDRYFRSSFIYSFIIQSFNIILVIVLLTPLYRYFIVDDANSLLFIIIVLLISKGWNLLAEWEEARLLYSNIRIFHKLFRFIVNVTLTYFLFAGAFIYFVMAVLIIKGLLLLTYYQSIKKQHSLKWEYLIEVEDRMVMFFYRIANMFTDVPKISTKVKRRRILSSLPNLFPFNQRSTFSYIYLKSFFRANDYLGIYVRLLIVAVILMFYAQVEFASIFIAALFLYMSALQLSTLWKHHVLKLWLDLYPIDIDVRKKAFSFVIFLLLVVKSIIFSVASFLATSYWLDCLLVFVSTMAFSYVYSYFLLHKKSI